MISNSTRIIDVQGHRGCRGLMPENTLEAFTKAITLGVDTLELDVAVSKDNIVVVSHEPFMSSAICLDKDGNEIPKHLEEAFNLYKMEFDDIRQFDCGSKFHPRFPKQKKLKTYKPSLDAVFKLARNKNLSIKFSIEIKAKPEYDEVYTPIPKDFVALVLKVVTANNAFKTTSLQSFDLRILEEIKQQAPKMQVALLVDEDEDIWSKISRLSFSPEIVSPYYKLLDAKIITDLQVKKFKVIPWTINEFNNLQQMIDFKVDGIITDYPDRLIDLLK